MKVMRLDVEKPVWRVMPDHEGPGLAIEVRSREEKAVDFFYLNLLNGTIKALQMENDWWKGLQEVQNNIVLLHGYENPGLPVPQGLFAFEGIQGKSIWKKPQDTFTGLAGNVLGAKNREGVPFCYHLSSGEAIEHPPASDVFEQANDEKKQQLYFPKVFIDGHDEFEIHHQQIKQHWEKHAEVQIDILRGKKKLPNYQVINFYHKSPSGSWNQDLGILKNQIPIFHKQIGTDLKGLSLDPFFIFQDYLIWIENISCLSYLRLG